MSDNLIGNEIESYCGKCKTDTLHLITSTKETNIDKVMCKICLSYHKYQKPVSGVAKTSNKKSKPKKVTKITRRSSLTKKQKLIDEIDPANAIEYKMDLNYEVDTRISHKKFGLGIVRTIIDNRKIEVLFRDKERVMAQNYVM